MSNTRDEKDDNGWSKDGPAKITTGFDEYETEMGLVHEDWYDLEEARRINQERQRSGSTTPPTPPHANS
jgi:hypothetical protein